MVNATTIRNQQQVQAVISHLCDQLSKQLTTEAEAIEGQIASTSAPTVYLTHGVDASQTLIVVSGSVSVHYLIGNHGVESVPGRQRRQQSQQPKKAEAEAAITAVIDEAIDAIDQGGGGRVIVKHDAPPPSQIRNAQVFDVTARRPARRTNTKVVDPEQVAKAAPQSLPGTSSERSEPSLRGILEG